jgi:(1->4)-alpha-D-glucan 1-alpha-D-glucosylmutase
MPELPSLPDAVRVPLATYRLQFNRGFPFDAATGVTPYLEALGISDVYASSYLAACPGSLHGYDITNHNALNPEVGDAAAYDRFVAALQARGMGQLLDVVPNHMGIAAAANAWWNDVLENGPSSPYAEFFDIEWDPLNPRLANKVLLPVLGDQFGRVLEQQELRLDYADGAFGLWVYDTRLPVEPCSTAQILSLRLAPLGAALGDTAELAEYQSILTALSHLPAPTERLPERVRERLREKVVIRRRLARLADACAPVRVSLDETVRIYNGSKGDPRSFDRLEQLLDAQCYRLAYWRVAAEEINYRRFFDINDLAAIRMENPAVFQEAHRLVLQLLAEGKVTGIRLDHPDGLFDPPRYFQDLQRERCAQLVRQRLTADATLSERDREASVATGAEQFEAACAADPRQGGCRPLYLVAEKILAKGERLPAQWAIHGTVGYEFLNLVGGLWVQAANQKAMTATYAGFTGQRTPFADLVYESKQLIMQVSMSSELSVLGHALSRLAERNRYSRDFTRNSLIFALREVIACFPVYRTYITGRADVSLQDRACVEVAVAFAKRRNPTTNVSIFDFVRDILLLRYAESADFAQREAQRGFVQKFQQLTAPVTAKGVEDTAFYRFNRLVSLNEVGGDPERFGVSVAEFHAQCQARHELWPTGLSTTSTHDTKRSEDVRLRIHALSEIPRIWRSAVGRWHRLNRRHLSELEGRQLPDRHDEYLLYQTLVGAWPLRAPRGDDEWAELTGRIQQYLLKAAKEAKRNTSWINPNDEYDEALKQFVARVLTPGPANRFLADLVEFQAPLALVGMLNSLGQTLVKIAAPGVPDFYQGTELWDFSLVDPDNRRPVDYDLRSRLLAELQTRIAGGDLGPLARDLVGAWPDGRIKLYIIHQALGCRRRLPVLFQLGDYVPLAATGEHADHLVAFARRRATAAVLVVVPRLVHRLSEGGSRVPLGVEAWGDTRLLLPRDFPEERYLDVFTGRPHTARAETDGLLVGELLADFPVALLESAAPPVERKRP